MHFPCSSLPYSLQSPHHPFTHSCTSSPPFTTHTAPPTPHHPSTTHTIPSIQQSAPRDPRQQRLQRVMQAMLASRQRAPYCFKHSQSLTVSRTAWVGMRAAGRADGVVLFPVAVRGGSRGSFVCFVSIAAHTHTHTHTHTRTHTHTCSHARSHAQAHTQTLPLPHLVATARCSAERGPSGE